MCNLYLITTNQAAIIALFRVMNRYVGNLPPMPGVFPDYPAPVVRDLAGERELITMRWGMPPPARAGRTRKTCWRPISFSWSACGDVFDMHGPKEVLAHVPRITGAEAVRAAPNART